MHQIPLILNMMPAAWMIPKIYKLDVPAHTLLNVYHKNLAIIHTADKHREFIKSIVDGNLVQLPTKMLCIWILDTVQQINFLLIVFLKRFVTEDPTQDLLTEEHPSL